jgi:hypothetical protein
MRKGSPQREPGDENRVTDRMLSVRIRNSECTSRLSPGFYPTSCISTRDKAVILSEALRRSIANRGLYGAESKDPGDACWQMLLRAFRPQTTPEDKKVTNSERTRISTSLISPATTNVVLSKENHTQPTEAATLDTKSGEGEGSAVARKSAERPGLTTKLPMLAS